MSNVAWVGSHSSRTRPISEGLSKYMEYRIRGYLNFNPWIIDYSGTPPPYFKERNKTGLLYHFKHTPLIVSTTPKTFPFPLRNDF